jgi:hypothetical protein
LFYQSPGRGADGINDCSRCAYDLSGRKDYKLVQDKELPEPQNQDQELRCHTCSAFPRLAQDHFRYADPPGESSPHRDPPREPRAVAKIARRFTPVGFPLDRGMKPSSWLLFGSNTPPAPVRFFADGP